MIRIEKYLQEKPRENKELCYSLLEIGINYYHLISLLWNPGNKTYTDNFLIWKTQEILEILTQSAINYEMSVLDLNNRLIEAMEYFKNADQDTLLQMLGVEIDNHPQNECILSLDLKIAILIKLLDLKGITIEQIFEKYQN